MQNNNFLWTLCTSVFLATGLYAGGDIAQLQDKEPYINMPSIEEKTIKSFYIGMGFGGDNVESYRFGKDDSIIPSLTAMFGYKFFENLALELRGSTGLKDADQFTHNYSIGVYLKSEYAINSKWSVYGLLGYGQSKMTYKNEFIEQGIANNFTKQNGISYGAGVGYKLDNTWSLFADAIRIKDKETTKTEVKYGIHIDGLTFGVLYQF